MTGERTVAHYNLLDRIGEGGIGAVFRARDTKVGRTVALKIVSPGIERDAQRLARLFEDAHAAMTLSHPNIATLFDAGEADGVHYLAYEFASGRTLREECGGVPMHARRAVDLAVQLADGVAGGHAHGIIHGDLRPETIIVTGKGSAKILDFGLAPWTRGGDVRAAAARSAYSLPVEAVSVLAYLSPEQAIGGAVDPRTDVFTLGTLAYEMLTGRNPFAGKTPLETVTNVMRVRAPLASEVNPAVPKDFDPILARAMTLDLTERQQSAASFAAELRSVGAVLDVRTGDAVHAPDLLPLDDAPDRNASMLLTSALVGAALAAAAVWYWLSR
jgi:eukaryotic-like serine/threonine-protein kinase